MHNDLNTFYSFLTMGGYGLYIWPVYGVAICILGSTFLYNFWVWRTTRKKFDRQFKRKDF
ncbi:MAG: heme exporter protein CcmD [Alphaproteobacteria bacterium]|nr:heme exporter protein CcmD [Alphaproteobacteria bacterium]